MLIHLGSWVIPLGGGSAEQLRQGQEFLGDSGPARSSELGFSHPRKFPSGSGQGITLSGMGTPDLRGTYGTFSFYTDDPMARGRCRRRGDHPCAGARIRRSTAKLIGPDNTVFAKAHPPATEPFTVSLDPLEPVAKIRCSGPRVRFERRRVERLGAGGVSADSIFWERERDVPLLSEANASAISSCTFRRSILIRRIPRCRFRRHRVIRASC